MTHLPHHAMNDMAYWSSGEGACQAPSLAPVPNTKRNLEDIEKLVAFFVSGAHSLQAQTAATIMAAPLVSSYDANNPLLRTMRELIDAES